MLEILSILGLVIALEGAFYAGFPGAARKLATEVLQADEGTLRKAGLVGLCLGVFIVWMVRG